MTPDEILQRARDAGLSMAEVCRRAQIAPSTWTRWKSGQTRPTLEVYKRLKDATMVEGLE